MVQCAKVEPNSFFSAYKLQSEISVYGSINPSNGIFVPQNFFKLIVFILDNVPTLLIEKDKNWGSRTFRRSTGIQSQNYN